MLKLFSVMNTTHRGSNGPLQEKEMSIYTVQMMGKVHDMHCWHLTHIGYTF